MKKSLISMMVMMMTIIGTISAYGAANVHHNTHRNNIECKNMHCNHRADKMHRTHHKAWAKKHAHRFNRHNVCVKCHMTKREIIHMMQHAKHRNHHRQMACTPHRPAHRR